MRIAQKNFLLVAGYVPNDAQRRTTPNGKELIEFSVKASQEGEVAHWVKCTVWASFPAIFQLAQTIKKGDSVQASGTFATREYNGKPYVDMTCEFLSVCSFRAEVSSMPTPQNIQAGFEVVEEDALPF